MAINIDRYITGNWGEDGINHEAPVMHCAKCGKAMYKGEDVWRTGDGDFCEDCAKALYMEEL